MSTIGKIDCDAYHGVVVLTGAGISVASGIRPYRGPGGIWNDATLVKFSEYRTFVEDPLAVWRFWWRTREAILAARPNPAHETLAGIEAARPAGSKFTLITQNIDGLHRAAGSRNLVEYHGNVMMTRCSRAACDLEPYLDATLSEEEPPRCPRCGAVLRPDIVMFGEMIPEENARRATRALEDCDLFVAIGTSGMVYPANQFVSWAARAGARTVYVNLESIRATDPDSDFGEEFLGRAEEAVPLLFGRIADDRSGGA